MGFSTNKYTYAFPSCLPLPCLAETLNSAICVAIIPMSFFRIRKWRKRPWCGQQKIRIHWFLWTGSVSENENVIFRDVYGTGGPYSNNQQTVVAFRAVVLIWMFMLLGSHSYLATNTSKGRAADSLQQVEACLPTGGPIVDIFGCTFSFTQSHDSHPDKGRVS